MTGTHFGEKRRGRPSKCDVPLPPHILKALKLRSQGKLWKEAAEEVGIKPQTLRKYMKENAECEIILNDYQKQHLEETDSKLLSFAPEAVDHLIEIIRNKKNKDYVRKDAIIGFFQIRKDAILDKENKDEIKELREMVYAVQGGRVVDI